MSAATSTRRTSRKAPQAPPEMVDVAFDLDAEGALAPGFEWPLYVAVARLVPWMVHSPYAGIHPLRGTRGGDGALLLARRAKIVLRMPRDRVCASSLLERSVLEVGEARLAVGPGTYRRIGPAPTLHSPRVALGTADEGEFVARLAAGLERLGIRAGTVCGRRVDVAGEEGPQPAFSVAVHGLDESNSLLLQRAGLGTGHGVGCGLFVPHKTITGTP